MNKPSVRIIALYKWNAAHRMRMIRAQRFEDEYSITGNPDSLRYAQDEHKRIDGMVEALHLLGYTVEDTEKAVLAVIRYKSYDRQFKIEGGEQA